METYLNNGTPYCRFGIIDIQVIYKIDRNLTDEIIKRAGMIEDQMNEDWSKNSLARQDQKISLECVIDWLLKRLFPMSTGELDYWILAAPIVAVMIVITILIYYYFKSGSVIVATHLIFWNHGKGILKRCKVSIQGRVVNNHMAVIENFKSRCSNTNYQTIYFFFLV